MPMSFQLGKNNEALHSDRGYQIWELEVLAGDPLGVFGHAVELEFQVTEPVQPGDLIHCLENATAPGQSAPRERDFVVEALSLEPGSDVLSARIVSADVFDKAVRTALWRFEEVLSKPAAEKPGPGALDALFNGAIALRNRQNTPEVDAWMVKAGAPLWLAQLIGLLARINQVQCGYLAERDLLQAPPLTTTATLQLFRANRKWLRTHDEIVREDVTGAGAMALATARVAHGLLQHSEGNAFAQDLALLHYLIDTYDYLHELHQVSAVSRASGRTNYYEDPLHAQMAKLRNGS
jgi:hypothetical protein